MSSRHCRIKDNCSNDAQPVVMEGNMHKDKFGFPRGRCTAGSCACEGFVVTKGTHDCKTCYHAPRHHEYYNKEQQQQQRPEQHNDNHQPISTKKKQTTTSAGKKFLTMVSIETPFPFLAVSITIHHFLKIVVVKMKFNYYIIINNINIEYSCTRHQHK